MFKKLFKNRNKKNQNKVGYVFYHGVCGTGMSRHYVRAEYIGSEEKRKDDKDERKDSLG